MNLLNIPKIELHCHLDGSIRPSTLYELANELHLVDGVDFMTFKKLIQVDEHCTSLVDYLKCFNLPLKIMQTKENLTRIAAELIEDVAKTNVKYIEVRFAPHLHLEKGLTFSDVVSSVLHGLEQGKRLTGTRYNLILCCMRHLSVETSIEVVDLGLPFLGKGVVAVDLAGDETHFPPTLHVDAFKKAKFLGYRITIHAGETGIAQNVLDAIHLLGAERIGHGLALKDDALAYDNVKVLGIPLEMCPTSNVQTQGVKSIYEHPIIDFLRDGAQATLNTDNMTVSGITLVNELNALSNDLCATSDDHWLLYKNAIEASFASDEDKHYLRSLIQTI